MKIKKIVVYVLMFNLIFVNLFSISVYASDISSDVFSDDDNSESEFLLTEIVNNILLDLKAFPKNYNSAVNHFVSRVCENFGISSKYIVLPVDKNGNVIIPENIISFVKSLIEEETKSKFFTVSPLTTGADTTKYSTYGVDLSVFKYPSSAAALIQFLREKGGAYGFDGNGGYNWFTFSSIDHSLFTFAYLDGSKRVRFLDSGFNPVNAVVTRDNKVDPLPNSQFTYDDLVSASASYKTHDGSTSYKELIFNLDTMKSNYAYYGKPFRCFTDIQSLYDYVYGNSNYYFTSAYYDEIKDISIKIDDLSKVNEDFYNNIYNLISQKLKDGVDMSQLQQIIDELVNEELKKIGLKLDDIGDDVEDTNKKLDTIISELQNILDTLGLLYEIDENGNVTIKNTNFNFNIDLNATVVVPIIDKLAEINTELSLELKYQTQQVKDLSASIDDIKKSLCDMVDSQNYQNDILIEKFNILFEKLDSLELSVQVDMTDTNKLLEDINDNLSVLDTVVQYLKDILNKLDDFDKLGFEFDYKLLDNLVDLVGSINTKLGILVGIETIDLIDELFGEDNPDEVIKNVSNNNPVVELLSTKFPFSMPWDLALAFHVFSHEPVCPVLDIPLKLNVFNSEQEFNLHIDGSDFEYISYMSRTFFTISFVVGLCIFTYKNILKNK